MAGPRLGPASTKCAPSVESRLAGGDEGGYVHKTGAGVGNTFGLGSLLSVGALTRLVLVES